MATEISFRGEHIEGGRIRITSPNLNGFRLIVHPGQTPEAQIGEALQVFYPLHVANYVRTHPPKIVLRSPALDYTATYD